jgi:transposase
MSFRKYSPDVKVLVIRLRLKGHSPTFINHLLGLNISDQSFVRWMKLFERTRCVVCNPDFYETRGAPRILSSEDREFISEILDADPTLYLDEMAQQLLEAKGVVISIATLAIEVRDRLAMTLKVARTVHPNQSAELRANFFQVIADIPSECLIFLGKSSCKS